MKLIHPFEGPSASIWVDGEAVPGAVAIANRSEWMEAMLSGRGAWINDLLAWRVIPPAADFFVVPSFDDGVVSRLHLQETTAVSGHAPGAFVDWSARRYEGGDPWFSDGFGGYSTSEMGLIGQAPWEFFVTRDERATPDEVGRALDLRFRCFTDIHGCEDAHEYLQPAPNR